MKGFMRCLLLGTITFAGTVLASDAPDASTTSDIYFVRNVISMDGVPGVLRQTAFNRITRTEQRDGSSLLNTRVLWSSENGHGQTSGTLELDANDPQERNLLALLAGGFDMRLERDGTARDIRAVDQKAWAAAVSESPGAARMLATGDAELGMRPFALPKRLRIGQEIVRRASSRAHGEVTTRMRVRALTDDVVVVDLQLEGDTISATGRQAMLRSDGMPIELRAKLIMQQGEEGRDLIHDMRVYRMSDEPDLGMALDDDMHREYLTSINETLASPPYSAPVEEAEAYRLYPLKHGDMEPWMLSEEEIAAVEESLLFGVTKEGAYARPIITIGGRVGEPRPEDDTGQWTPQMMMVRVNSVTLQDAARRPLPDLDAIPVATRQIMFDRYRVREPVKDFPFRLPLQTHGSQLEPLEFIQFEVDVETYAWEGVEVVQRGAQSKRNPAAKVIWTSPHRITLQQDRGDPKDRAATWTIAVPLYADGTEIPSAVLSASHAPIDPEGGEGADGLPLEWENRQAFVRQEIATPQPIAAVELRHYRYAMLPRTWTFRNARNVLDEDGNPIK